MRPVELRLLLILAKTLSRLLLREVQGADGAAATTEARSDLEKIAEAEREAWH